MTNNHKNRLSFLSGKKQLTIALVSAFVLLILLALSLKPFAFKSAIGKLLYSSNAISITNNNLNYKKLIYEGSSVFSGDEINSKNSFLNMLYLNDNLYLVFSSDSKFKIYSQNKITRLKLKEGKFRFNSELATKLIINNKNYSLASNTSFELEIANKNTTIKTFSGSINIDNASIKLSANDVLFNNKKIVYEASLSEPFGFYNINDGDYLSTKIMPHLASDKKIKAIELSNQADFKNIIYRRPINELEFFRVDLPASSYFWRFIYDDNSLSYSTPFIIFNKLAMPTLKVKPEHVFDKDDYLKALSLSNLGFTALYITEIAEDEQFFKLISREVSNKNKISVLDLPNGRYFYRITAKNYTQNKYYRTPVSTFIIDGGDNKTTITDINSVINSQAEEIELISDIDDTYNTSNPIDIDTNSSNPVEILEDISTTTPVKPIADLPKIEAPKPSVKPVSTPVASIPKQVMTSPPVAPTNSNINPNATTINLSAKKSLDFSWSAVAGASDYSLVLNYNGKQVSNKTFIKTTTFSLTTLNLLNVGDYSWSLTAYDRSVSPPAVISKQDANFSISLDEMPDVVYDGEKTFLLSSGATQKISWQAIPRASKYNILVSSDSNPKVFSSASSLTTFTMRLPAGKYNLFITPLNEFAKPSKTPTPIAIEVK